MDEFPPVEARFLRFSIQRYSDMDAVVDEFEIYAPNSESKNVALAENGSIASSSNLKGGTVGNFYDGHLNDGIYGDQASWRSERDSELWIQIQLPILTTIHRVIWSRDRTGEWFDHVPLEYRIEVAREPGRWVQVASSADRQQTGSIRMTSHAAQPAEYLVDSWEEEDGFPLNSINDIAQTPDGYLWIASENGLIRFDGHQFNSFDQGNTPALSTPRIPATYVDQGGRMWICNRKYFYDSRNNLVVYEKGAFKRVEIEESYMVKDFFEENDGQFWILTNLGAIPWVDGKLDYNGILREFDRTTMEYLSQEKGKSKRLRWRGRPGEWIHGQFVGLLGDDSRYLAMGDSSAPVRRVPRRDGGAWVLEGGLSGAKNLGPNRWRRLLSDGTLTDLAPFPWGEGPFRFQEVLSDSSNNLWIAVAGQGLFCLHADGMGYKDFRSLDALKGLKIREMFEDVEGDVWLGAEGAGLKRLRKRLFKVIGADQGMNSRFRSPNLDNTYSVAPSMNGGVWIGTHSSSAYRWKDGFLSYLLNSFVFSWAILEDREGFVWTGAYGRGARRHYKDQLSILPSIGTHPFSFMEDSHGRIWSGGDYGLFCFDHGVQYNYVPPSFAKSKFEWVISLAEDSKGAIWIGTKLGLLHRYQDGQFETVWKPDAGSEFPVCALHFDPSGTLWMARYGFGLTRYESGHFSHFTQSEGLPASTINGILDDPRGYLWMTSKQGVYRISHEDFGLFEKRDLSGIFWQRFTEKHGLPSNECNGEQNQPSLCQTDDGRIWIPTQKGVGFIDPAEIDKHRAPPRLVIQDVTLYGSGNHVETLVSDGEFSSHSEVNPISISVPPGNNNLMIRYTAVDFTEPKQVRFKYRILGLDDNWVDAQNERAALIASLRSGSYRFELMASSPLGVAGDIASLEIIVSPFWWETTGFRILLGTLLLSGGFAWSSSRVKQLKRRNAVQADFSRQLIEREEAERKRISQELHDSLGHDLLLVRNRALDGANRSDSSREKQQFDSISEMAGKALENARGMAYNLRPFELDRIGFQKAVESMVSKISESSETRYFKDIDELDDVVTSETLVYLYRLLQEGLNNILKHSQASVVMIEIKKHERQVRVQLDDNGLGFDMSIPRSGLGLRGMEERLKLIGGQFRLTSAPGAGTQIRIEIPI
ncbi:histidine kinase [Verrucomicrobia bacterium]|nr:histidine kinase [Verrucomicrobiota bacterium]